MTDHKRELRKASLEAATAAAKAYKARNPEAQSLRTKASVVAYKPRAKAVKAIPVRAIHLFISDRDWVRRSNADIADHFRRDTGERIPANILTEAFKDFHLPEIESALARRGIKLDLKVHNSPSKVKKALAAIGIAKQAEAHTVSMTFTEGEVVVGERAYPIQAGRRIHVGNKKLNVDALRLLITSSK